MEWGDWLPVTQVSEFSSAVPSGAVAPVAPSAPAAPAATTSAATNPYSPPQAAGPASVYQNTGAEVPTYLWQSIVVTLLCCWPFGIPAIVFASKVGTLLAQGDVAGAREASEKAKMWCWISAGGFVVGMVLYVGFIILVGAASEM